MTKPFLCLTYTHPYSELAEYLLCGKEKVTFVLEAGGKGGFLCEEQGDNFFVMTRGYLISEERGDHFSVKKRDNVCLRNIKITSVCGTRG